MKKILFSFIWLTCLTSLTVGASFALYSDVESFSNNVMTAAGMDLVVNTENPLVSTIVNINGFLPSESNINNPLNINVQNAGQVAGKFYISLEDVVDFENNCIESETSDIDEDSTCDANQGELSGHVVLSLYDGAINQLDLSENLIYQSPVNGFFSPQLLLNGGEIKNLKLVWEVLSTAPNKIQSDSVSFKAIFVLDQVE